MFPDEELAAISAAAHSVGALFVLDCVASGTAWVGRRDTFYFTGFHLQSRRAHATHHGL